MLPRYFKLVTTTLAFTLLVPVTAAVAAPDRRDHSTAQACSPLISENAQGARALGLLGAKLPAAAKLNGRTEADFTAAFDDPTQWIDKCGRLFFVEEAPGGSKGGTTPPPTTDPLKGVPAGITATSVFTQHSNLGAPITIYLDFNSEYISGTAWNASYNANNPWTTKGFSTDADFTTFSQADVDTIYSIWQRVSEDYAAFNVDVTTEKPLASALDRTNLSDQNYGVTALIGADTTIYNQCGCGGLSYVGVADLTGTNHLYYQPAWIFTAGLGNNPKYIAEAASHEIGHNFGLSHDGTTTSAYYSGSSGWAPIMGVGYYQPLVQWSKGEYPSANNLEDDYAVMATHGLTSAIDEDLNTAASARTLYVGTDVIGDINSPTDSDWFKITPSASGSFTFNFSTAVISPNLDLSATLLQSDATTVISSNDPAFTVVNSDQATGLGTSIAATLTANQTYFLTLKGVGFGDITKTGYTNYGSIGQYKLGINGAVAPLAITNSSLPNATTGVTYSQQLTGFGGYYPYSWSASGLPSGVSINSTTGLISGASSLAGNFTMLVTLTGGISSVQKSLTLVVVDPLIITTKSLPNITTGTAVSYQVLASGGSAPYIWGATGLPTGLSMSSSGVISGSTSVTGTYSVQLSATDIYGTTSTLSLPMTVVGPLKVSTASLPNVTTGISYSAQLTVSGGLSPYTWSATGLPAGLIISTTGLISGIATAAGTYPVNIVLTDAAGSSANAAISMLVINPLTISTASLPIATKGVAYSTSLAAAGGLGAYSWTATGVPAGLVLSTSGVLSGTPTTAATSSITFTLRDSLSSVSKVLSLSVVSPINITTASLPNASVNISYSTTLAVSGGLSPYTWSATGLPSGLLMSSTGTISGKTATAGTYALTVSVQDSSGLSTSRTYSLAVVVPLVITSTSIPAAVVSTSAGTNLYSYQMSASGGTSPYTWSATGLPTGFAISSSGLVNGSSTTTGSYAVTVTVKDSAATPASTSLKVTFQVVAPLVITSPTTLPNGTLSKAYSYTLAATGGSTTKSWSISFGALPKGISLSSAGVLSGKPTLRGTYQFTVTVTSVGLVTTSSLMTLTVV